MASSPSSSRVTAFSLAAETYPADGFHPTLKTTVTLPRSLVSPLQSLAPSSCTLHLFLPLSPLTFFDPYELSQYVQAGIWKDLKWWGETDLELPYVAVVDKERGKGWREEGRRTQGEEREGEIGVEKGWSELFVSIDPSSSPYSFGVKLGTSDDNIDTPVDLTISIPLHMRYGDPSFGGGSQGLGRSLAPGKDERKGRYHTTYMKWPRGFVACPNGSEPPSPSFVEKENIYLLDSYPSRIKHLFNYSEPPPSSQDSRSLSEPPSKYVYYPLTPLSPRPNLPSSSNPRQQPFTIPNLPQLMPLRVPIGDPENHLILVQIVTAAVILMCWIWVALSAWNVAKKLNGSVALEKDKKE